MKLADWLDAEKITQDDFASRIGTSQAAVARYAKGLRIPRPATMTTIARETKGNVTAQDFYDIALVAATIEPTSVEAAA